MLLPDSFQLRALQLRTKRKRGAEVLAGAAEGAGEAAGEAAGSQTGRRSCSSQGPSFPDQTLI